MKSSTLVAIGFSVIGFAVVLDRAPAQQPREKEAVVEAIPAVIVEGARWELAWAGVDNADGIVGTLDGGLLFAQEQPSRVQKLDVHGRPSVFIGNARGVGALSMDTQGRLLAVLRACTDPGRRDGRECREPTSVSVLAPEREILADRFQNGDSLGRLNDLVADGQGGAYFTAGGAYYVNRDGLVTTVTEEIRANGIMLSRDERTLYVTNREVVVAFDVRPDGSVTNRRNFGSLSGDCCADGMAIDAAGRLYVTASAGVHVFSPQGRRLGLIPTPRPATTVAFSGPDKTTLYAVGRGARGPDGNEYTTPDGVRNNAKTIYRISILAGGFKGRAK